MDRPADAKDLPSGGWVLLRDVKKLTQGQREDAQIAYTEISPGIRELIAAQEGIDEHDLVGKENAANAIEQAATADDMRAMFHLNRVIAATIVAAWSFDLPITAESLRELQADDYDELMNAGAKAAPQVLGGVDFGPTPPGEESPTEPVSAS
jgi:hypothetical protein